MPGTAPGDKASARDSLPAGISASTAPKHGDEAGGGDNLSRYPHDAFWPRTRHLSGAAAVNAADHPQDARSRPSGDGSLWMVFATAVIPVAHSHPLPLPP